MQSKIPVFIWGVQDDLLNDSDIIDGAISICKSFKGNNLTLIMPMSEPHGLISKIVENGIAFKSAYDLSKACITTPTLIVATLAEVEKVEKYAGDEFEVIACRIIKTEDSPQVGKAAWNMYNSQFENFISLFSTIVVAILEQYIQPVEQGLLSSLWGALTSFVSYPSSSSSTALPAIPPQGAEVVTQLPAAQNWASSLTFGYVGNPMSK